MIQYLRNRKYKNAEMVSYWKTKEFVEAKILRMPEGHDAMQMQGEKYLFPGRPRESLLYGNLSPLKHQIKTKIFNEVWAMLEAHKPLSEILPYVKKILLEQIFPLANQSRYDMVPFHKLSPPIKEIHRAMTVVGKDNKKFLLLRDVVCFILQEDDAYRMRFQWVVKFFPRFFRPKIKHFEWGLRMLEQAELVGDMKERQRLFKRVFMTVLEDRDVRALFEAFLKEVHWKKVALTKADKYFFRAKYFKVDYPEYQY